MENAECLVATIRGRLAGFVTLRELNPACAGDLAGPLEAAIEKLLEVNDALANAGIRNTPQ
jgi:hypothetical protein